MLLTTFKNMGSTTLFNSVFNNLQQLVIFCRVLFQTIQGMSWLMQEIVHFEQIFSNFSSGYFVYHNNFDTSVTMQSWVNEKYQIISESKA